MEFTVWVERPDRDQSGAPTVDTHVRENFASVGTAEKLLLSSLAAHLIKCIEVTAANADHIVPRQRITIRCSQETGSPRLAEIEYTVEIDTEDEVSRIDDINLAVHRFWQANNTAAPNCRLVGSVRKMFPWKGAEISVHPANAVCH